MSTFLKTIKHLGSGSFAQAYLSQSPETKELYAVKRIPLQILTDEEKMETLKEVEILKLFSDHFNIVKYYYYRIIDFQGEEVLNDFNSYHLNTSDINQLDEESNENRQFGINNLESIESRSLINKRKKSNSEIEDDYSTSSLQSGNLGFEIINNKQLDIVMEYCDQGNLEEFLKQREGKLLPEQEIMDIFVQICHGLSYVHGKKILHRDLKSQNIFLKSYTMQKNNFLIAKLGDFGISKVLEGTQALAKTMVGTPFYISPELVNDEPYGMKSDMWSLGCILYNLCTMKHAWNGTSFPAIVLKIATKDYEPIPNLYSDNLKEILRLLLQKDPNKRISVNDLLNIPFVKGYLDKYLQKLDALRLSEQLKNIRSKSMIDAIRRPRSKSEGHKLHRPYLPPQNLEITEKEILKNNISSKNINISENIKNIDEETNNQIPTLIRCKLEDSLGSEESDVPLTIRVSLTNRSMESIDSFSSISSSDLTPINNQNEKKKSFSKEPNENKIMNISSKELISSSVGINKTVNNDKSVKRKSLAYNSHTPLSTRARSKSIHVDTRPQILRENILHDLLADDTSTSDDTSGSFDSFEEVEEFNSEITEDEKSEDSDIPKHDWIRMKANQIRSKANEIQFSPRKIPIAWKSKHESSISSIKKELENQLTRSMEQRELRLLERRNAFRKRLQEKLNSQNDDSDINDLSFGFIQSFSSTDSFSTDSLVSPQNFPETAILKPDIVQEKIIDSPLTFQEKKKQFLKERKEKKAQYEEELRQRKLAHIARIKKAKSRISIDRPKNLNYNVSTNLPQDIVEISSPLTKNWFVGLEEIENPSIDKQNSQTSIKEEINTKKESNEIINDRDIKEKIIPNTHAIDLKNDFQTNKRGSIPTISEIEAKMNDLEKEKNYFLQNSKNSSSKDSFQTSFSNSSGHSSISSNYSPISSLSNDSHSQLFHLYRDSLRDLKKQLIEGKFNDSQKDKIHSNIQIRMEEKYKSSLKEEIVLPNTSQLIEKKPDRIFISRNLSIVSSQNDSKYKSDHITSPRGHIHSKRIIENRPTTPRSPSSPKSSFQRITSPKKIKENRPSTSYEKVSSQLNSRKALSPKNGTRMTSPTSRQSSISSNRSGTSGATSSKNTVDIPSHTSIKSISVQRSIFTSPPKKPSLNTRTSSPSSPYTSRNVNGLSSSSSPSSPITKVANHTRISNSPSNNSSRLFEARNTSMPKNDIKPISISKEATLKSSNQLTPRRFLNSRMGSKVQTKSTIEEFHDDISDHSRDSKESNDLKNLKNSIDLKDTSQIQNRLMKIPDSNQSEQKEGQSRFILVSNGQDKRKTNISENTNLKKKKRSFPVFELVLSENLVSSNTPELEHISISKREIIPSYSHAKSYSNDEMKQSSNTKSQLAPSVDSQQQSSSTPTYNLSFNMSNMVLSQESIEQRQQKQNQPFMNVRSHTLDDKEYYESQSTKRNLETEFLSLQSFIAEQKRQKESKYLSLNPIDSVEQKNHYISLDHGSTNLKSKEPVNKSAVPILLPYADFKSTKEEPTKNEDAVPLRFGFDPPTPTEVALRHPLSE